MSSSEIAIKVSGVSKCFQIYDSPHDRLKQFVLPRVRRILRKSDKQYFREFWALNDVSFEVRKGETIGVIGQNGSGKSTLLQIICGTLTPTLGNVTTKGRIGALLELGSGFNPDFTGRENVYLNASVLGLSKGEVDDRLDQILAFADIGNFIDQPVKTYSSGMVVRLAFAVQSQINPDILIVDEALSVGDAKFQAKCFERLRQLKDNGTSILLVTHSAEQVVAHCSSAVLLNEGKQLDIGRPRDVVNRYMDLLFGKSSNNSNQQPIGTKQGNNDSAVSPNCLSLSTTTDLFRSRPLYNNHEYRWGDGAATILDFLLSIGATDYPTSIPLGEIITLTTNIKFTREIVRPILGVTIKTKEGITVYGANSETLDDVHFKQYGAAGSVIQIQAKFRAGLGPGDYFISLGVASRAGDAIVPHDRRYDCIHLRIPSTGRFFGLTNLELELRSEAVTA